MGLAASLACSPQKCGHVRTVTLKGVAVPTSCRASVIVRTTWQVTELVTHIISMSEPAGPVVQVGDAAVLVTLARVGQESTHVFEQGPLTHVVVPVLVLNLESQGVGVGAHWGGGKGGPSRGGGGGPRVSGWCLEGQQVAAQLRTLGMACVPLASRWLFAAHLGMRRCDATGWPSTGGQAAQQYLRPTAAGLSGHVPVLQLVGRLTVTLR